MSPNLPEFTHEHKINHLMVTGIILLMVLLASGLVFTMRYHPDSKPTWRIAITNWPGFDPLYLANKEGFFKQNGLNIKLIPINSITDMRTAYERGIIDGYTGTIMDAVDSLQQTKVASRIPLITDYSNGGDQILGDPSITSVADLRGKRLGIEVTSSMERYILQRALETAGLTIADLDLRPSSQTIMVELSADRTLDAVLTYEPFASQIQFRRPMHVVFDSSQLPQEVIDVLIVSQKMTDTEPNLSQRLQLAWQSSQDYANAHPDETNTLFANRYNLTVPAYKALGNDFKPFTRNSMQSFVSSGALHQAIHRVATVFNPAQPLAPREVSDTVTVWFQQEAH